MCLLPIAKSTLRIVVNLATLLFYIPVRKSYLLLNSSPLRKSSRRTETGPSAASENRYEGGYFAVNTVKVTFYSAVPL